MYVHVSCDGIGPPPGLAMEGVQISLILSVFLVLFVCDDKQMILWICSWISEILA
jgi:hypothetical protein